MAKTGDDGVGDLDELLAAAAVRCVAVDAVQAHLAREAFERFGKGRAPAGLNFGDCFSYALAKAADRPLLFKGSDFSQADVAPASVRRVSRRGAGLDAREGATEEVEANPRRRGVARAAPHGVTCNAPRGLAAERVEPGA